MRSLLLRLAPLAVLAAGLSLAPTASAQGTPLRSAPRATDLVEWHARIVPGDDRGEARYVLDVTVADGWNVYGAESEAGIPLTVTFGRMPDGVATRGDLRETRTVKGTDPALGQRYEYHVGRAQISQGLRVDRRATGRHRIRASVRFAVCNDSVCLPPTTVETAATLAVAE